MRDQPGWGDTLRYRIDRFLSWNPSARFFGLFGLSAFLVVVLGLISLVVVPDQDLGEALWWSMTRAIDSGTMGGDTGFAVRLLASVTTLAGVGVVALFIGLVASTIEEKLDDLRKGRSPVIDSGHTLIVGYSEKVFSIIAELAEANVSRRDGATIAILSPTPKEEVETAVRERLEDVLRNTRVVVREGSPFLVHDLRKVGAGRARSIIILSDESVAHAQGAAAADMGVIKSLLALRRIKGALGRNHAAVELMDASRRTVVEQLGAGGVEVVAMNDVLSRMMVQSARQSGLAQVFRDLLTFSGSEFYFRRFPELAGRRFGELQWMVDGAVVCGVRQVEGRRPRVLINPPDDLVLAPDAELLVIAEDEDTFSLVEPRPPRLPPGFTGATPVVRAPERLLVCGASPKLARMLQEFDQYVLSGSEVWLMPGQGREAFSEALKAQLGGLKRLRLKHVEGDPTVPEQLRRVVSPDFAAVLVVADTRLDVEEADARTVITVLLLRSMFRHLNERKPRIISEILDPRTKELIEQDYGADFVVSAEMTSMLLAQVSERRELNEVFNDLFDPDGNELYLKRAACFAVPGEPTTWLSVQRVARQRGEVAIGYLKDGRDIINPPQLESLVLDEADRVIVIAHDDSEAAGDSSTDELAEPARLTDSSPPPRRTAIEVKPRP